MSKESVVEHIDEDCVGRCFVFVDGQLDPALSCLEEIEADSVEILHRSHRTASDQAVPNAILGRDFLDFIPDVDEIRRDRYQN